MKHANKLTFGIAIAILLVIAAAVSGLATPKTDLSTNVAYIDSSRILAEHPEMKKVTETLKAKTTAMQGELDAKAKSADKAAQQKLLQEYQTKLDAEKQILQAAALKKINATIKSVAKSKGYTLVFDSRAVIYGGTDITNAVLSASGVSVKK